MSPSFLISRPMRDRLKPARTNSARVTTPCARPPNQAMTSSAVRDWRRIPTLIPMSAEVRPPAGANLVLVPTLRDPWTLAGHELPNRLVLAPLAGIGNWFVRLQAKRYGAGL